MSQEGGELFTNPRFFPQSCNHPDCTVDHATYGFRLTCPLHPDGRWHVAMKGFALIIVCDICFEEIHEGREEDHNAGYKFKMVDPGHDRPIYRDDIGDWMVSA